MIYRLVIENKVERIAEGGGNSLRVGINKNKFLRWNCVVQIQTLIESTIQ